MVLRIGLAYNQKPSEATEPPSSAPHEASAEDAEPPSGALAAAAAEYAEPPSAEPPHGPSHDRYAEWDEPATIAAVEAALRRAGTVIRLEADADFPRKLQDASPDIVFNIAEGLNGPNREAHVPAICEFYGVPYTGSDVLTLALALDKRRAKEVFAARGVPTAPFAVVEPGAEVPERFPVPAVVKPVHEGSSMGITERSLCTTADQVRERAREIALGYGQPALVEGFLPGREFTIAVMGNNGDARALPIVEIRLDALPAGAAPIYGYEAKWLWDTVDAPIHIAHCPADVPPALAQEIQEVALAAYHALGCRDWGRVDVRLDADGRAQVIEINPLPGILPDPEQHSFYPTAARAAGLDYEALIGSVLQVALRRCGIAQ